MSSHQKQTNAPSTNANGTDSLYIDNNDDQFYQIRMCPQCGKNFFEICDSSNSFCNKGCHVNWLDSHF